MDKAYIEQAAKDYANQFKTQVSSEGLQNIVSDFIAGVEWLLSLQEEIEVTKQK